MSTAKGIIRNTTTADISAKELAHIFDSQLGKSGILKHYYGLQLFKENNNQVGLRGGVYSLMGYMLEQSPDSTSLFTIESNNIGYNRNDLLVAEFVRNGISVGDDLLQFKIVKGTATTGIASDPTLTKENISFSGNIRQEAIYRIKTEGETITEIERVAPIISTVKELEEQLTEQAQSLQSLNLVQSLMGDYSDGRFKKLPWNASSSIKNNTILQDYFPDINGVCGYIALYLSGDYRLLIGMEYANLKNGAQLELRYNGLFFRNKTDGAWGAWRSL